MKIGKKVSALFALFSGIGILTFAIWFFNNFREDQLIEKITAIPSFYGLPEDSADTKKALYYHVQFSSSVYKPGIRVMSKDFNATALDLQMAGKKEITAYFQPKANSDGINEIYQIRKLGQIIYTFDERFNPESNGNFFAWFSVVVASILILFGLFSVFRGE